MEKKDKEMEYKVMEEKDMQERIRMENQEMEVEEREALVLCKRLVCWYVTFFIKLVFKQVHDLNLIILYYTPSSWGEDRGAQYKMMGIVLTLL